jgi:hypothetical protein
MQAICLKDEAFYALVDKLANYLKEKHGVKEDKWISGEEAMKRLRITSKSTLQKLRDEGNMDQVENLGNKSTTGWQVLPSPDTRKCENPPTIGGLSHFILYNVVINFMLHTFNFEAALFIFR